MNAPLQHTIDLASLAKEALSEAAGKTDDAVIRLDRRLGRDKALRTQIISAAVHAAMREAVSMAHRADRATIVRAAHSFAGRDVVEALASGLTRSLLDFPLLDGTKLRDATRETLMAAIQHYRASANTMNHRANWLSAIADLVPVQGRVGDVVDDEIAQKLFEESGK